MLAKEQTCNSLTGRRKNGRARREVPPKTTNPVPAKVSSREQVPWDARADLPQLPHSCATLTREPCGSLIGEFDSGLAGIAREGWIVDS